MGWFVEYLASKELGPVYQVFEDPEKKVWVVFNTVSGQRISSPDSKEVAIQEAEWLNSKEEK